MLENTIKYIISTGITGSILVLIFTFIKPLLKRLSSFSFIYRIKSVIFLIFLFPFSLIISNYMPFESANNIQNTANTPKITSYLNLLSDEHLNFPNLLINLNNVSVGDSNAINSISNDFRISLRVGVCIWILGMIAFLIIKLLEYKGFKKVFKIETQEMDDKIFSIFKQTKTELNIKGKINLIINNHISSPMTCGVIKTVVIIPKINMSDDEWRYVFLHELTHIKRRDLWLKIVAMLACAIHWFNPLIHIAFKNLDKLCEFSCDEEVMKKILLEERKSYGMTILNVLEHSKTINTAWYPALCSTKDRVKERITMIFTYKAKKHFFIIPVIILAVIAICSNFFVANVFAATDQTKPKVEIDWWTYEEYKEYLELNATLFSATELNSLKKVLKMMENEDLYITKTIVVDGESLDHCAATNTINPYDFDENGMQIGYTNENLNFCFSELCYSSEDFLSKIQMSLDEKVALNSISLIDACIEYEVIKDIYVTQE